MIKRIGIAGRLALVLVLAAFSIAYLASQASYRFTYNAEISNAKNGINELFNAVSSTASIAAFVQDEELMKEVINGLATSKLVKAVAYKSEVLNYSLNVEHVATQDSQQFDVTNPFIPEEKLGSIQIWPDYKRIEQYAKLISLNNAFALFFLATVVSLVSIIICYYLITKPLIKISRALHRIKPGTEQRIPVPSNQKFTEIGSLVSDTNSLLSSVERKIIQERNLRIEIEELEKQFRIVFENARSPIALLDLYGNLVLYNQAFVSLLEQLGLYTNQQNKRYDELLTVLFEEPASLIKAVQSALANDEFLVGEYRLKGFSSTSPVWVQLYVSLIEADDGEKYYQVTLNDISNKKKELESLTQQADYDALTGILNRNGGTKAVNQRLFQHQPFTLALVDLNGFKQVNDELGHDAGDEVLIEVAKRLEQVLRQNDVAIRWGGDEFVLILAIDGSNSDNIKLVMDKVRDSVMQPISVSGSDETAKVGMSVGVAIHPVDATDLDELIRLADIAMYRAKANKVSAPEEYIYFAQKKAR